MWVAFATNCRFIVGFIIGPRKQYVADELVELIDKSIQEPQRDYLRNLAFIVISIGYLDLENQEFTE